MYDENLVNESLEACKDLADSKNSTSEEVFAEISSLLDGDIQRDRPWEKTLKEIGAQADNDAPPVSGESFEQHDGNVANSDNGAAHLDEDVKQEALEKASDKKKSDLRRRILGNAAMLAVCVAAAFLLAKFITTFVAHQTTVEGASMEPSLKSSDSLIIEKLTYYWRDPERYDVVVFSVSSGARDGREASYIKRVIGLPGEMVQIIDGEVYIDGIRLKGDDYSEEEIKDAGLASSMIRLKDDEYFVLGDNRNMSSDSRYEAVGVVKGKDISGRAMCCIWPVSHIKFL